MQTMILKACKRCSGDLALHKDHEVGVYADCLQCGHVAYPSNVGEVVRSAA